MESALFNTRLTRLFGCRYPIIQGGLGYWSNAELAAAVSNAGGLGVITSFQFSDKRDLQKEIRKAKTLTDKPFGVNINLFPASRPGSNDEVVDIVIEEGVSFVETAGRSPEAYLERLHQGNVKVVHKVPGAQYAHHAEKVGVDAVTVVGFEGGGHPGMGEVTTFVLVPITAKLVKIPVIAAGGIANGQGLLAALALGAAGVTIGTRFLTTKESPLHPLVKESLLQAKETDTMIIDRSIRSARRVLRNPAAERVLGMQQIDASLDEQLAVMGGMASRGFLDKGDLEHGVISCGQGIGLIHDSPTVEEVINRIVKEASETWKNLGKEADE
jgi:NAD(P)H-dependent flavin oxidoreductase YrpB (nitropropane dioxygenase family)